MTWFIFFAGLFLFWHFGQLIGIAAVMGVGVYYMGADFLHDDNARHLRRKHR